MSVPNLPKPPKIPAQAAGYNKTKSPNPLGGCTKACQHYIPMRTNPKPRYIIHQSCEIVEVKGQPPKAGCLLFMPKSPLPNPTVLKTILFEPAATMSDDETKDKPRNVF